MYLNKKQFYALQMALDAMDYRNSGAKDEEQEEAYDTIVEMLASDLKAKRNRQRRKQNVRSSEIPCKSQKSQG